MLRHVEAAAGRLQMSFAKSVRKGVTFYDPLKADDGYTLICPQGDFDVLLIDMEGHVVHRWRMPHLPGSHGMLLPNGNLLFAGRTESNPAGQIGPAARVQWAWWRPFGGGLGGKSGLEGRSALPEP